MQASLSPRLLAACSVVTFVIVFAAFARYETPGLGIARFFYLAIALFALSSGPLRGAAAGVLAAVLYTLGVVINPSLSLGLLATPTNVFRVATYVVLGVVIGWFAAMNREMMAYLRALAEKDLATGMPRLRPFADMIGQRLDRGQPFALLVGQSESLQRLELGGGDGAADDEGRQLADTVARWLEPGDEVARLGAGEFAILASGSAVSRPAQLSASLEWKLRAAGHSVTFGWARSPQEARNALALYAAATDRLYARKLLQTPPASSAEASA
jgi:GGDEF domain-containing protein